MKLYEVNQAIEAIIEQSIDPETGEVLLDTEELMTQLDGLELERTRILEYLAKLVLNTRSEAAALKAEETRLKARREGLEKKDARLMEILDRECAGTKTDLGIATVSYRKTSRLDVQDSARAIRWLKRNKHPECFRVPEPEVNKTETKKLLKSGVKVPGVEMVDNLSCSLK